MGWVAAALTLAGAATSAAGAHAEGEAANEAAQYNAKITRMRAADEAYRVGVIGRRVRGENITRIAKSGVRQSGSALAVLVRNAKEVEQQQQAILRAARASANLYEKLGNNAQVAAKYKIANSVLSGLGGAASQLDGVDFGSLFGGKPKYWAGGDEPKFGNIA